MRETRTGMFISTPFGQLNEPPHEMFVATKICKLSDLLGISFSIPASTFGNRVKTNAKVF